MNRRDTGWSLSSIPIANEETLLRVFNVQLGKWTKDEFSDYCPVMCIPRSELPTLHEGEEPNSEKKRFWEIKDAMTVVRKS